MGDDDDDDDQGDLFDSRYPWAPGFKAHGTSEEAAARISAHAHTVQARLLALMVEIHPAGLTSDEAAACLGYHILTLRPRMSELRKIGLVVPTTERRTNVSGMRATVWCVNRVVDQQ